MLTDCQCFHPLYLDRANLRGGEPPCNLSQSAVELCVENIFSQFNTDQRRCNCNATCLEVSYDSVPSVALWPSKQYEVRTLIVIQTGDQPTFAREWRR